MQIKRPETFDEIIGNDAKKRYLQDCLKFNSLPQGILFYGDEGTGKTALAQVLARARNCRSVLKKPCGECPSCKEISEKVINGKVSTDSVKYFNMALSSKEDSLVPSIKECMNTNFLEEDVRILILDEVHQMSSQDQDSLLTDMDPFPEGVYMFAITTDVSRLQKTFLSRLITVDLNHLNTKEMCTLLKREADRQQIKVERENIAFPLIAEWCEGKPRQGLKLLEGFGGVGRELSLTTLKSFINYLDIKDIIPIISSFDGNFIIGLNTIRNMTLTSSTQNSLIDLLIDTIKIAKHERVLSLSEEDRSLVQEATSNVDVKVYNRFLYQVANIRRFDRRSLIAAYLRCHPDFSEFESPDNKANILKQENSIRSDYLLEDAVSLTNDKLEEEVKVGGWSDLLRKGTIIK